MSAIAFNVANPYLTTPINPANQAQAIVQQSTQGAAAAALSVAAAPIRNQTLQAVAQGGQSDASRTLRSKEDAGKGGDSRTGKLTAENNASSAARGGRRPGSQINILV